MVHVYSLTFHCLELLSDGPDAKLIMIFTRVTDKDTEDSQEHAHHVVYMCHFLAKISIDKLTIISQGTLMTIYFLIFANMFSNSTLPQLLAVVN